MIDLSERITNLSPQQRELLRQQLKNKRGDVSPIQIVSQKRDSHTFPLSFAQQRLWFLDQLEPNNSAYNIPAALRLKGSLNVVALQQSLTEISQRHEALRTTFAIKEGQPVQVITPVLIPLLIEVDLRSLPEARRETEALRLATAEAQRSFDLSQGPLLRITLLRLAEEEHILLLIMHHIISDGWSLGVFFRELTMVYAAFTAGQSSPLPELPIQYIDFTVWQREWLQGKVLEAQLSYWKEQLGGSLPILELPTDRSRPAMQSFQGAHYSFVLSQELTEKLKELSRQERVTLFMALLAAFKTLLYRYSRQEEIIVGSPIANRNRREVEGLIGFFVNSLVLRTDLRGRPSFREVLRRVREMTLGAYEHQDLPFEKLVAELQLERDLSRTPLFQVMFILQNAPMEAMELSGLNLERIVIETGMAKFDLTLAMMETNQGLAGTLEYNMDLFDAERISRLAGHFQCLLEGIVAAPEQSIASLPLLTTIEWRQLLLEWNETVTAYPEVCVHQLLEAQVAQTPEAVAIVFEDESLSYEELNRRANQVAHYLRKLGVGPETLVGICLERSLEMIIGLVGILKAGGAYVPLDPAYPSERITFMLQDAGVSVLLTQEHLAGLLQPQTRVVCLGRDWAMIAKEGDQNLITEVTPKNLAYVIYTSGSTGKPKGVQILHRAVVNFLHSMQQQPGLAAQDILLSVTTLSFDIAALELFLPLMVGARLVIASREAAADGTQLLQRLASSSATVMQATPTTWQLLLEAGWRGSPHLKILCGGEALSRDLAKQLLERSASLWNLYGPTETTIWSTVYQVGPGERSVPIGRPIVNTQVYLLDSDLQPVPIGVPGELYIGGVGLARGYLHRPELTAEKFILDPFSNEPGARLYKTGDLARYLSDGNIEFLGRIDHQVKIRGFRIELGEIETVLSQHPAVRETVVLAHESRPGEKRLVAYVVPHQEQILTSSELRSFLKEKLPDYLVPSTFITLDALPLTPNGKVDRRALPVPDTARPTLEEGFILPRDKLELQLAKIWEQILGLKSIGVKDNFFDLGGYSLLAVRLFLQIEKVFGEKLPLTTLFQAPTIEQLADVLRGSQAGWSAAWSSLVAIQPGGSNQPFFCVPGNLGNVFVDLGELARYLGPDQPFYGLQDGIQNPSQIEALAAHYVNEIRSVQPEGPYLLGGVCSGGVVAFEMAQQLQAKGQKVALLALIEPSRPPVPGLQTYFNLTASVLHRVVQRFGHHSRNLAQYNSAERRPYAHLKAKLFANMWAVVRYAPKIYPGQITLFLAHESLAKSPHDPRLGWREWTTEGVELRVVPGSHNTITRTHDAIPEETHIRVLAEQLRARIDDAVRDVAGK